MVASRADHPAAVTSTHGIGVPSNDPNVTVSWSASTDAQSGVVGYDLVWDQTPISLPDGLIEEPVDVFAHSVTSDEEGADLYAARWPGR